MNKVCRHLILIPAILLVALTCSSVSAQSSVRVRELTCSDGTVFTGEQVRNGFGTPPQTWRNVNPGEFPTAFVFHAAAVTSPDGVVVPDVTWDHSLGVANNHELVTCSFMITIGPFAGYRADFIGYFIPEQE